MAGEYSKRVIELELLLAAKGTKDFEQSIKSISSIEARTRTYNKVGREMGLTQAQTDKVMGAASMKIDNYGNIVNRAGKEVRHWKQGMRDNIGVLARFNMEQLGVMFGGMALNRAMVTLNATSREWLGIGELTSTMMGITMLEANIDLLEYGVIPLFEALTNLPPEAQKAIGYVSFALEGLGLVMMGGGQLMLGLDSTATMLSKIAGVRPELIFKEKGLSALKTKLSGTIPLLKSVGKYAAAGILISIALKDLTEDQVMAATGDVLLAMAVFSKGTKAGVMAVAGIGLKLFGDEDFLVDVIKVMYRIGEITTSIFKEAMWSAMTFRGFDIKNIEGRADVQNAMDRAYEEISMERADTGEMDGVAVPVTSLMAIQKKIEELEAQHTEDMKTEYGRSEEALAKHISDKEKLETEMEDITQKWRDAVEINEKASNKKREAEADRFRESFIGKMAIAPEEITTDVAKTFSKFTSWFNFSKDNDNLDKPKAVGGKIRNTGRYYLHEGEEVISKSSVNSGQTIINATYNVNVSDKREFEDLLRKNNQQLISEVRRTVKV